MKREIIAIVLAVVMVLAMSTAAYAEGDTTSTNSSNQLGNQSTTVTYTKSESYTWTVPSTITAGSSNDNDEVTASNVFIAYGKQLTITACGIDDNNQVTLTDTDKDNSQNTIKADVTYNTLTIKAGTQSGDTPLKVADPQAKIAGTYSGTITFTATVENQPVQNAES